jgi:hypothetical protein
VPQKPGGEAVERGDFISVAADELGSTAQGGGTLGSACSRPGADPEGSCSRSHGAPNLVRSVLLEPTDFLGTIRVDQRKSVVAIAEWRPIEQTASERRQLLQRLLPYLLQRSRSR